MLKPTKRITKRQMKEDKFVTYYFKATHFVREHLREIGAVAGGIVIVLIVYGFYSRAQLSQEQDALTAFAKARSKYFDKSYEQASLLLTEIVEKYGGTSSGKLARFYLADALFQQKKYDQAERYFTEYSDQGDDRILEASSISGIAACLEEKGKFVEAATTYKQAADKFRDEFMAPENLLNSARCYDLAGDKEKARSILNELIETYSTSQIKNEAEMFLAEIVS